MTLSRILADERRFFHLSSASYFKAERSPYAHIFTGLFDQFEPDSRRQQRLAALPNDTAELACRLTQAHTDLAKLQGDNHELKVALLNVTEQLEALLQLRKVTSR